MSLGKWRAYPLCECARPYAVLLMPPRGVFAGIAAGGRRVCHVCNGRVPLARSFGPRGES